MAHPHTEWKIPIKKYTTNAIKLAEEETKGGFMDGVLVDEANYKRSDGSVRGIS